MNSSKVAVLLCGSGFKDGSEIRESVAALWALSQSGAETHCFAPDATQHHVVNCLTGEVAAGEARNMLVESARIARSKIEPLKDLVVERFDALLIPGGFGVAKNLCDFAFKGSLGTSRLDVTEVIQKFYANRKPVGAICIAPALVALSLKGHAKHLELTLGSRGEAAQEIEKLGFRHIEKLANECHVDRKNLVVTTPAYMYDDAPLHEIFTGIQLCVRETLKLSQATTL